MKVLGIITFASLADLEVSHLLLYTQRPSSCDLFHPTSSLTETNDGRARLGVHTLTIQQLNRKCNFSSNIHLAIYDLIRFCCLFQGECLRHKWPKQAEFQRHSKLLQLLS